MVNERKSGLWTRRGAALTVIALGCAQGSDAAGGQTRGAAVASGSENRSEAVAAGGTRGLRVVGAGAGAQAPQSETGTRVRVRIEARRGGQPVEFRPGATLRSGDRIVIYARSDRDGWLNVVQFYPDGTSGVLSSSDGSAVQARAGEETRIPSGSDEIELDDVTGEENVYVVSSARPLAEVDQAVSRLVSDVRTSGSPAPSSARPAARPVSHAPRAGGSEATSRPGTATARPSPDLLAGLSRGMRVVSAHSGGGVESETDADARGVGVVRVTFRHE